jgi:hypothetical protein
VVRLRPGSGQVSVIANDGTVTVTGRAGVVLLRPRAGAVFVQASPDPIGYAGAVRLRAGAGSILTTDEPAVTAGGSMLVHDRPGVMMRPRERELEGV